eukprot:3550969-Rhodomonas_salina.2
MVGRMPPRCMPPRWSTTITSPALGEALCHKVHARAGEREGKARELPKWLGRAQTRRRQGKRGMEGRRNRERTKTGGSKEMWGREGGAMKRKKRKEERRKGGREGGSKGGGGSLRREEGGRLRREERRVVRGLMACNPDTVSGEEPCLAQDRQG